jgi:hypothetical protein
MTKAEASTKIDEQRERTGLGDAPKKPKRKAAKCDPEGHERP